MNSTDNLAFEIRCQRNGLASSIVLRKEHPTYGYTKAGLKQSLARLEGMLAAWAIIHITDMGHASVALSAMRAAEALDIDLAGLQQRVVNA